ncbi:hypothetical protein DFP72DRAFT_1049419 [Ephemerocybe angulata]|uniref:Uncharacterized protein n=1 Tax=Ephemerocybe angulata TaxID=980116 RepID=A0A8H6M1C5_9AGAR|nr:hypothetical protein DFP72DRAFT_1049419 [Tulosesus angulatus]
MTDHKDPRDRNLNTTNAHGLVSEQQMPSLTSNTEDMEDSKLSNQVREPVTTPDPPSLTQVLEGAEDPMGIASALSDSPGQVTMNTTGEMNMGSKAVENPMFNLRTPPMDIDELGLGNKTKKDEGETLDPLSSEGVGRVKIASSSAEGSTKASSVTAKALSDILLHNTSAKLGSGEVRTEDDQKYREGDMESVLLDDQQGHFHLARREKTGTVKTEDAIINLSEEAKRPKEDEERSEAEKEADPQLGAEADIEERRKAEAEATTAADEAQTPEVDQPDAEIEGSSDDLDSDDSSILDQATEDDSGRGDPMAASSPGPEIQDPAEDPTLAAQTQALAAHVKAPPVPGSSRQENDAVDNVIRLRALEGSIKTLMEMVGQQDAKILGLENTIADLETGVARRDGKIGALKEYNKRLRDDKKQLESELNDARERAEAQAQNAQREEASLRESLRETESALNNARKLLGARTEELTAAQAFMVTADKFSVADVLRLVEQLNDDAYQCAVMVSDAVLAQREALAGGKGDRVPQEDTEEERKLGKEGTEEERKLAKEARDLVVPVWGEEVVGKYQADIEKDGETFLFEMVVQSALVMRMKEIIQKMHFGSKAANKVLVDESSIANNWLSITHTQLKTQHVENEQAVHRLMCVARTAGYLRGATLPAHLQKKLEDMTKKALKIKEMASEGVLSAEVEVFAPRPSGSFNPERMQDEYAFGSNSGSSTVTNTPGGKNVEETGKKKKKILIVVSTGLGVQCSTKGKSEVALKSKVLLQSALDAAMPGIGDLD